MKTFGAIVAILAASVSAAPAGDIKARCKSTSEGSTNLTAKWRQADMIYFLVSDSQNNGGLLSSIGLGGLIPGGGGAAGGAGGGAAGGAGGAAGGALGGLAGGAADLLQGAVGQAGGIAGDIVNTPLDLASNLGGQLGGLLGGGAGKQPAKRD